jgi:16S rRNA (cytidine1402-2'-O)-methyltransferase
MLSLVSTPIWNLEDITLRALRTLREADLVICEDTRHSGHLLKHFEISKPLQSFHSHSTREQAKKLVERAKNEQVAYISDAGTPGISDPAYLLIQEAIEQWVTIEAIPGASALLTGLIGSWIHMHDFRFIGFLPLKKGRQTLLKSLKDKEYTAIIYESPHRIEKTLSELEKTFWSDHRACLARELTKIHETYHRDTLENLQKDAKKGVFRGEIVIIF